MIFKFTKMHGLGNDFIVISCDEKARRWYENIDIIKRLCNRRLGIGADQLLLVCPSSSCDCKMKIFNSDGSEVEMCGNGIRCIAKYMHRRDKKRLSFTVETMAGVIRPEITGDLVKVDMGEPELEGKNIPLAVDGKCIGHTISAGGMDFSVTSVSMGNPHCVIFCDSVSSIPLDVYGPYIEKHSLFPNRTNVEFVEVLDRNTIKMRVWERGAGITSACGTGACASAVASVINDHTQRDVEVILEGGKLNIKWDRGSNHVFMTGQAEFVFEGEIDV